MFKLTKAGLLPLCAFALAIPLPAKAVAEEVVATPEAKRSEAAMRTAKEKLGTKASDEQRVNNCKVPQQLRGPGERPDGCKVKKKRD